MKKKIIAIAMLATMVFSSISILTGCGEQTDIEKVSTNNSENSSNEQQSSFDIDEKIHIIDGKFENTPLENANLINNALKFYDYPAGQVFDTGNFVTLYYNTGDTITISDANIRISGDDAAKFPVQALAVVGSLLVDSDKADDYNNLVSTQILNFETYGEKSPGGIYSTHLAYDNFSILGMLHTDTEPTTVSFTFFSK